MPKPTPKKVPYSGGFTKGSIVRIFLKNFMYFVYFDLFLCGS